MSPNPTKATLRDWIGLALLVTTALLVAMDLSVLLFAVPELSETLQPSGTQLLWIIDIYGFTLAGLLITLGTLGDRIGRRRLLMIGAGLFAAASLAAAFAPSAEMLIVLRVLLGIGGATLAPSTLGLIRNMFHDDRQRQMAVAIWTGGFAGGAALGPIVGGLLLQHFWWGSVFLLNLPTMLLVLVLAPMLLPESRDPHPGRFDLFSAILSLVAVLAAIYGVKEMAQHGFELVPAINLVAGILLGVVFVIRQRRLTDPLIDVGLFAIPAFSAAMLANALCMFAMLGISLFHIQYLLVVLGYEPFVAALWSLLPAAAVPLGITAATLLSSTVPRSVLIGAGLLFAGIGLFIIGQITIASGLVLFLIGSGVMTVGVGMVAALANDMVLAAAPPERASAASALSETGTELSGALGVAILGSIGTAAFHAVMSRMVPAGLPADVAEAAGSTLGGAVAAAQAVGGADGAVLMTAAHQAFMSGYQVTANVGGVVLIASAIVTYMALRRVPLLTLRTGH